MLRSLVGDMAIGHVRYSTTGSSEWENAQPIVRDDSRTLALAHNGNLINAVELHARAARPRRPVSLDVRLGDHRGDAGDAPGRRGSRTRSPTCCRGCSGAFSTVVHDRRRGRRVPRSARPPAAGARRDRGRRRRSPVYCVASESCAFDLIGAALRPRRRARRDRHARTPTGCSSRIVGGGRAPRVLRVRVHLLRAAGLADGRRAAAGLARADGRDPVARGAGRRRPGDRDPGLGQRRRARARARRRDPAGRRLHQEPLRRADLHPARAAAAPPRPAAEVQPAARGRRAASG